MRIAFSSCLALTVALVLWTNVQGQEQKEVTIKGQMACANCGLKIEKTCMAVVVEKKDGKDVVYYFDTDSNKKYHGDVCSENKDARVIGTVTEKDGKKTIMVKEVKYEK